jgi:hypothetical protein
MLTILFKPRERGGVAVCLPFHIGDLRLMKDAADKPPCTEDMRNFVKGVSSTLALRKFLA